MKKVLFALCISLLASPVMADYCDENACDNYVGFRIHKNENIAFAYKLENGGTTTLRRDNFGLGAVVGNRLSDYVKVEFETSYTGGETKRGMSDFDYDVWANMFNMYLLQEYSGAVSPYVGIGVGFAGIWSDIDSVQYGGTDYSFDLSYQAMLGVNFALNTRIDVNFGLKYQYYGAVEHGTDFANTDVSATEFYFGAVYKFGLK